MLLLAYLTTGCGNRCATHDMCLLHVVWSSTLMFFLHLIAGLSGTPGLEICSHVLSPIVFLKLKKSTGSLATDLDLLETIAEQVTD